MNSNKIESIREGKGIRSSSRTISKSLLLSILGILFLVPAAIPLAAASAPHCVAAGGTGMTAYMVVSHSHQKISGMTIDATGCDIGIYVAPWTHDVQISGNTITGANDHGIMVQDASEIRIVNNLVTGNGVNGGHSCNFISPPCIAEDKALQLVGTKDSFVGYNVVSFNSADGGIGVTDDNKTFDPAALAGSANGPHQSVDVWVVGNSALNNLVGCGIVASTYDEHVGLRDINILYNTITGSSPSQVGAGAPPYVGQIVVATDGQLTSIFDTVVSHNTLAGSLLPGIVVHSNVFGDKIIDTKITDNILTQNGFYPPQFATGPNDPQAADGTTGIALIAEVGVQPPNTPNPILAFTIVRSNTVLGDQNGVWICHTSKTLISNLQGNSINKIVSCPS